MKSPITVAAAGLLVLDSYVAAHGYVQQILLGDNLVEAWNPYKDPQKDPAVQKITRHFLDNGPVTDGEFTTDAITCNYGAKADSSNNVPVDVTAEVPAGSQVTFFWTDWQSDHPGPTDCQGPCSAFSGSTGDVWVKIHQAGYDPDRAAADGGTPWASKRLPEQNSTWTVALPATLRPGQYVLRHEILGLQRTNTDGNLAQFYPACHQIAVTGTGTAALPAGIALPGAYRPDDTTSIFLEYRDISPENPYTAPGGEVWGDDGWSDLQNMVGTQ
ncbi:putative family 61 endoglucanase protein [Eutypa lata UCREL1]|uniref:lytic cellulose monooxygenase (C4-dehydrogenating) n=1 Tax=Eutypa lata (strain UCR-EL1) TaxID=1287681 RepID=M7TK40_EUTLA|nr:putative family 61 endoglucanase protein [Eutypa lata UCREL1]